MVDVMGKHQEKFKHMCLAAYIYLRRYAKLIVNLFILMIDSGIEEINHNNLLKLVDKF